METFPARKSIRGKLLSEPAEKNGGDFSGWLPTLSDMNQIVGLNLTFTSKKIQFYLRMRMLIEVEGHCFAVQAVYSAEKENILQRLLFPDRLAVKR